MAFSFLREGSSEEKYVWFYRRNERSLGKINVKSYIPETTYVLEYAHNISNSADNFSFKV